MLRLLTLPTWTTEGQAPCPLPLTLPGALLVVLAVQPAWMTREQLAMLFWPDVEPTAALHHLRINLHRARKLLAAWGCGEALQADRSRVQLQLPCDVRALRDAQGAADAARLAGLNPSQWLQGWRLPGHEGFAQWCDDTAQRLQDEWLAASRQCQPREAAREITVLPGREAESRRLLASPAPALLLLGEPGSGKSSLLRAAYPHAPCLQGLEGLHTMPYRPLLDCLRSQTALLVRALREPGHPLRPYRLDLARVLPELAPDEPLPPLDALTARTRLVEALARAFEALTPVLLVDDLQWCDDATVEWLLMLAHSGRLRWRAAARPHALSAPLQQALQSLHRAVRLETLELGALDLPALTAICRARWPAIMLSTMQLERLHLLSGGNVFALSELMTAGLATEASIAPISVQQLVIRRLQMLPEDAREAVCRAAVFVQAMPPHALGTTAPALAAGLLREEAGGLSCRHDLIRQSVLAVMPEKQRAALHREAAAYLAAEPYPQAADVAAHCLAGGDAQQALRWQHRSAEQFKARGRFEEARTAWEQVSRDSADAALALRARLELAALDLFDDLARGEAALQAVRAQLPSVLDAAQRRSIEARALAALVDNRVFAGDIPAARTLAERLRELLPELAMPERVDGVEVLIELAMREPDIPAAWALLAQLRELAPQRPTLLSFEGQIHWFDGHVQAAHDALARLLERHPDYCRGITIENDLAVMLQALGRLDEAEQMARRSLQSWAGVAHTETLSLLVLGLVLTSAGRHEEAEAALQRGLDLAREQASAGFEAEALVRRARLMLQQGRAAEAQQALDRAAPLLASSPEPLRVSQLVLAQVQAAFALGHHAPAAGLQRLQWVSERSAHPLVHLRVAHVHHLLAMARGDQAAAFQAAADMAALARRSGIPEAWAEALLLQAQSASDPHAITAWREEAAALAASHGLLALARRAAATAG